jgi:hypothetical protein
MQDLLNHNYSADFVNELPGGQFENLFYFSKNAPKDGVIVRVTPKQQEPWIGVFAFGDWELNELFSTPDPNVLGVISRGSGYFVNVSTPSKWENMRLHPIIGVFQIESKNWLIFHDFGRICAWGSDGLVWLTDFSDDVVINAIHDELILGTASLNGKPISFTICVNTGNVISSKPTQVS